MGDRNILWRRLDRPGHESARLLQAAAGWDLVGTAVFAEGEQSCRLDYRIECDSRFHTRRASVSGWVGDRTVDVQVAADSGRWSLDGTDQPAVEGAVDIDLNFSPSTNLLPVRRLRLAVGEEARVRAAWLRFPGFKLEPLEQVYRRVKADAYLYKSASGFVAELELDEAGFVTHYPKIWVREGC